MKSLSIPKLIVFILFSMGVLVVYYKKVLTNKEGVDKKLILIKHIGILFAITGLLNIVSIQNGDNIKIFTGLVVFIIINIYNIDHSVTKCKFPPLYKVNLYGRSIIIILFSALLLYYSYQGTLFRFLYSEVDEESGDTKYTVTELEDKLGETKTIAPDYCPDMTDNEYKKSDDWINLSSAQKNACSAAYSEEYERKDISNKIYA